MYGITTYKTEAAGRDGPPPPVQANLTKRSLNMNIFVRIPYKLLIDSTDCPIAAYHHEVLERIRELTATGCPVANAAWNIQSHLLSLAQCPENWWNKNLRPQIHPSAIQTGETLEKQRPKPGNHQGNQPVTKKQDKNSRHRTTTPRRKPGITTHRLRAPSPDKHRTTELRCHQELRRSINPWRMSYLELSIGLVPFISFLILLPHYCGGETTTYKKIFPWKQFFS